MQFRELDGAAILNVPLVTCEAVKGVEIRAARQTVKFGEAVAST
jgi:hypothetical protein